MDASSNPQRTAPPRGAFTDTAAKTTASRSDGTPKSSTNRLAFSAIRALLLGTSQPRVSAVVGFLNGRDVQLLLLHHLGKCALRFRRLVVADELRDGVGHDLPGQAVLVLQPAADLRGGIAASAQLLPVVVDFFLVLAAHLQRDRLVELEDRAAVQGRERPPVELELDDQHGAGLAAVLLPAGLAVVGDLPDLRVLEDPDVVPGRLERLAVEPQAGGDPGFCRHRGTPVHCSCTCSRMEAPGFDKFKPTSGSAVSSTLDCGTPRMPGHGTSPGRVPRAGSRPGCRPSS